MAFAVLHGRVFLESAKYLPAPLPVDGIIGDAPHHEKALHRLWALQIVRIGRLDDVVLLPLGFGIPASRQTGTPREWQEGILVRLEPYNLWGQSGLRDMVHAPACLHEFSRKLHLMFLCATPSRFVSCFGLCEAACCTQGNGTG